MSYPILSNTASSLNQTIEVNQKLANKRTLSISMSIIFITLEFFLITVLFFLLYAIRMAYEFNQTIQLFDFSSPRFESYLVFYIFSTSIYLFLVYRYRIYTFRSSTGLSDELFKMIKAYSFAILFTIGISFLLKNDSYSRLVVVGYWGSLILLSILLRLIKRRIYFSLATSGLVSKNVLIVGAGKVGQSLVEELNSNKWLGYKVAGLVDDDIEKYKGTEFYLGNIENIRQIVNTQPIDELIITIPSERELVNQLLKDFRKIDININIIPDMFNLVMSSVKIGNINALPVVTLIRTPMRGIGFIAKRMFDMIVACILLLILSPVLLITGILIKLSSEGPAIYKQQRIGKHGRLFNMYKFRSMVVDADKLLRDLELNNEVDGLAFKIKNDPRITPVGKFIRKYSIDELPQLINVLVGDMSLVGPRPPVPHEVERYGDWEWRRLEVLPGMTGLWQVSGRSDLSFQQWMNMDVYYIENWSLGLDIKIMFKTISVVMKGEGAY